MVIPLEKEVYIYHSEVDTINRARIEIPDKLIEWLRKMRKIVIDNNIESIADYDASPEYFYVDDGEDPPEYKEPEDRVECEKIIVRQNEFYWKGLIKHSDPAIHFETEIISFNDLEDLIKFYEEEPLKNMPKFINDDDYSKREIALHRMKGE
jgi:hypothetical protein